MVTVLYSSETGMVCGLHLPSYIVPPEKLELEVRDVGLVTFTVLRVNDRRGRKTNNKIA